MLGVVALALGGCRYLLDLTERTEGVLAADGGGSDSGLDVTPDVIQVEPECIGCPPKSCRVDAGADAGEGGTVPSILGVTSCGQSDGGISCCTHVEIEGGTYNRFNDPTFPATVRDFEIDKYEVTVGRFKKFVQAGFGSQAKPPAPQSGAHPKIPFSGWDPTWNTALLENPTRLFATLDSCAQNDTGTFNSADQSMPVTCVTWFEAFAFCIWDGGRLPTEAEWNYVASAGSEQRHYPWSVPPADDNLDAGVKKLSNYCSNVAPTSSQPPTITGFRCQEPWPVVHPVGSLSPQSDSKHGVADLAGNAFEHVLDYSQTPAPAACDNCAVTGQGSGGSSRVLRGGSWLYAWEMMQNKWRERLAPGFRAGTAGFRCAYDKQVN